MLYANGCSYTEGHELQQKRQSRYSNIPTQLQIFKPALTMVWEVQ